MDWAPLDLKNLAALYDDMAEALLALRKQNADNLSQQNKQELTAAFGELISGSETFEHLAVQGALTGLNCDVKELQNAAHDAIAALQTITDVQKALGIAVAATALVAALVTMPLSAGAVASALGVLVQGVKAATAAPPDPHPAGGGSSHG